MDRLFPINASFAVLNNIGLKIVSTIKSEDTYYNLSYSGKFKEIKEKAFIQEESLNSTLTKKLKKLKNPKRRENTLSGAMKSEYWCDKIIITIIVSYIKDSTKMKLVVGNTQYSNISIRKGESSSNFTKTNISIWELCKNWEGNTAKEI